MSQTPAPNTLDILVEKRPALLLAEIGAWLHMLGKYYEGFLPSDQAALQYATQLPPDLQKTDSELGKLLRGDWAGGIWAQLGIDELQAGSLSINHLIEGHHDRNAPTGFVRLMNDAHGRGSGIEKGALERFAPGQTGNVYAATAMGMEAPIDTQQLAESRQKLYNFLAEQLTAMQSADAQAWPALRSAFVQRVQDDFRTSLADSRRPFNDVTIYDQTFASVAMFKAALAQNLLAGTWQEPNVEDVRHKYHWRILRIGLDGPALWGQANGINDMLSRKGLVAALLDQARNFLEKEVPLGMEMYRDEHGSLFIAPDIENLLEAQFKPDNENLLDEQFKGKSLRQILQQKAQKVLVGEASFDLQLSKRTRSLRVFGSLVAASVAQPAPLLSWVEGKWAAVNPSHHRQVCTVCGLRPQGPAPKSIERGVCDVCEQRRTDRSEAWAKALDARTIWMGEVADQNGRLGLLLGKFDILPWLSGDAFNSILSFDPLKRTLADKGRGGKQYEFSYEAFIQDIEKALATPEQTLGKHLPLLDNLLLKDQRPESNRLKDVYEFYTDEYDGAPREAWRFALALMRLQPSFARLRRTWETTRRFWQEIEESLGQVVGQVGPRLAVRGLVQNARGQGESPGSFHAYELVLEGGLRLNVIWDQQNGRFITADNLVRAAELLGSEGGEAALGTIKKHITGKLPIEEPSGYGAPNKSWGVIEVAAVDELPNSVYAPVVPILAEPGTFMALVPAGKSLAVIAKIREKYDAEMGKVANRLPLRLGLVCAPQHTPLRAILDAGWRMLDGKWLPQTGWRVADSSPETAASQMVTLSREGRSLTWNVPLRRGDGSFDAWYPYAAVETLANAHPLAERARRFQSSQAFVHVTDLRQDDRVTFVPSSFDFEWLDSAARRFEIAYDPQGSRRDLPHRPYLFGELETLERIWHTLHNGLSKSQIYALRDMIEDRRENWQPEALDLQPGGAYWQFCYDALRNTEWGAEHPDDMNAWAGYTVRGWLADAVELHLHILKESEEEDQHA